MCASQGRRHQHATGETEAQPRERLGYRNWFAEFHRVPEWDSIGNSNRPDIDFNKNLELLRRRSDEGVHFLTRMLE